MTDKMQIKVSVDLMVQVDHDYDWHAGGTNDPKLIAKQMVLNFLDTNNIDYRNVYASEWPFND